LIYIEHVFAGCLREMCNTTFCIVDSRCCPFLKCLVGNINSHMNILLITFDMFRFKLVANLYFKSLERERLYDRIQRHDFVERGVRIRHNKFQKVGLLGLPNVMYSNTLEL
jgi:hypothetical protein